MRVLKNIIKKILKICLSLLFPRFIFNLVKEYIYI